MKTLLTLLFPTLLLGACCLAGKCDQDDNLDAFRILSKSNGSDLLFGPSAQFNKFGTQFFSLRNGDTVWHYPDPAKNPQGSGDSILYVSFDFQKADTVYVHLDRNKLDTLILQLNHFKGSKCCGSVAGIAPQLFNNHPVTKDATGVYILER